MEEIGNTTEHEEICGEVMRITFRGDDGYTVARVLTEDGEEITCVGTFETAGKGDVRKFYGRWVDHPRYGIQFNVDFSEPLPPKSTDGIVGYLSSGLIPGIGKALAERIVSSFGDRTIEILDKEPNRLKQVPGIGEKRIEAIKRAWREQHGIRELVSMLRSHGISVGTALRIHKQYGAEALSVIQENPYRLALEVWGIGFSKADEIALKMGVPPDSPERIRAGIHFVLWKASEEGHVFLPADVLLERVGQMLGVRWEAFEKCLCELRDQGGVIEDENRIYLPQLYGSEVNAAARLRKLLLLSCSSIDGTQEKEISKLLSESSIALHGSQEEAIRKAIQSKVMIITGGPGTGKTTIIKLLVDYWDRQGRSVSLAAPTGRAAKRMSELAGYEAKTIHRLLEYSPVEGLFRRDSSNPLDADVVIVDESSMIDLPLAEHLLSALRDESSIIFVGDVDQLAPVGVGSFFADLVQSRIVPTSRLTKVFRQREGGSIVENAHRINSGEFPIFTGPDGEFVLIEKENPGEVADVIVNLCSEVLPTRFGYDPEHDIQVLSPMYKGEVGATVLNQRLQATLNPDGKQFNGTRFRVGDKVMQIRNNYEKMVFNGDIGEIVGIDEEQDKMIVRFDSEVEYERADLDELTHAYAVTVHKSQGSEFKCVVMPVITQHYVMLHRNLLYTAVTRAKQRVIMVGTKKAIGIAIRNIRLEKRYSWLVQRLLA